MMTLIARGVDPTDANVVQLLEDWKSALVAENTSLGQQALGIGRDPRVPVPNGWPNPSPLQLHIMQLVTVGAPVSISGPGTLHLTAFMPPQVEFEAMLRARQTAMLLFFQRISKTE